MLVNLHLPFDVAQHLGDFEFFLNHFCDCFTDISEKNSRNRQNERKYREWRF